MSYLEEDEIAHLFAQIALPLHLVHSNNILHRDLKVKKIDLTFTLKQGILSTPDLKDLKVKLKKMFKLSH